MTPTERPRPERTLDWTPAEARALGDEALDIWVELLERLHGDLPVARNRSAAQVREAVGLEIPSQPMPLGDLAAYLRRIVFDESMYPGHPGFVAYISGAGTVPGAAADLIAAGLNQNTGGWRLSPAASEIEQHLIRWFAGRLGMPASTSGYITTGGPWSTSSPWPLPHAPCRMGCSDRRNARGATACGLRVVRGARHRGPSSSDAWPRRRRYPPHPHR